jgi:hypothetical protein
VIGYHELLILVFLLAAPVAVVAIAVFWIATRLRKQASAQGSPRSAASRLTELDALRDSGRISSAEYDRQRSVIISSI